jgi:hypothetical protein
MDTLKSYQLIKQQSEHLIENRHLYVANIIKNLFNPLQHKNLCEIGAGKLELAGILAKSYKKIDAYELQLQPEFKSGISNLRVYSSFSRLVNVSNYHLLISVCPYYYAYDLYDDIDSEEETQNLVTDILDLSIENRINLFVVLSNTYGSNDLLQKIKNKDKYKKLTHDNITLHYEKNGEKKISNNKVLIYRR